MDSLVYQKKGNYTMPSNSYCVLPNISNCFDWLLTDCVYLIFVICSICLVLSWLYDQKMLVGQVWPAWAFAKFKFTILICTKLTLTSSLLPSLTHTTKGGNVHSNECLSFGASGIFLLVGPGKYLGPEANLWNLASVPLNLSQTNSFLVIQCYTHPMCWPIDIQNLLNY